MMGGVTVHPSTMVTNPLPSLGPRVRLALRWRAGLPRGCRGALALAGSLILAGQSSVSATQRWGTVVYVNTPSGYALNSRWGPGITFGIHTQTRRGCPLVLSGASRRGWLQLTNGTWVASHWVSTAPRERIACPTTPMAQRIATVTTPPGYALNIRTGPGTNHAWVGQYGNGARLPFTGEFQGNWTQLTDGHWVDGRYLQFAEGDGPSEPLSTAPPRPDPITEDLQRRLRQSGFLPVDFPITGVYDPQTQAAVRDFQRVNSLPVTGTMDGTTWHALYDVTESSESARPPFGGRQMRVSADDADQVDVFSGPGPEYGHIGTLANGTIVTTTGQVTGNWTEILDRQWIFTAWLDPL